MFTMAAKSRRRKIKVFGKSSEKGTATEVTSVGTAGDADDYSSDQGILQEEQHEHEHGNEVGDGHSEYSDSCDAASTTSFSAAVATVVRFRLPSNDERSAAHTNYDEDEYEYEGGSHYGKEGKDEESTWSGTSGLSFSTTCTNVSNLGVGATRAGAGLSMSGRRRGRKMVNLQTYGSPTRGESSHLGNFGRASPSSNSIQSVGSTTCSSAFTNNVSKARRRGDSTVQNTRGDQKMKKRSARTADYATAHSRQCETMSNESLSSSQASTPPKPVYSYSSTSPAASTTSSTFLQSQSAASSSPDNDNDHCDMHSSNNNNINNSINNNSSSSSSSNRRNKIKREEEMQRTVTVKMGTNNGDVYAIQDAGSNRLDLDDCYYMCDSVKSSLLHSTCKTNSCIIYNNNNNNNKTSHGEHTITTCEAACKLSLFIIHCSIGQLDMLRGSNAALAALLDAVACAPSRPISPKLLSLQSSNTKNVNHITTMYDNVAAIALSVLVYYLTLEPTCCRIRQAILEHEGALAGIVRLVHWFTHTDTPTQQEEQMVSANTHKLVYTDDTESAATALPLDNETTKILDEENLSRRKRSGKVRRRLLLDPNSLRSRMSASSSDKCNGQVGNNNQCLENDKDTTKNCQNKIDIAADVSLTPPMSMAEQLITPGFDPTKSGRTRRKRRRVLDDCGTSAAMSKSAARLNVINEEETLNVKDDEAISLPTASDATKHSQNASKITARFDFSPSSSQESSQSCRNSEQKMDNGRKFKKMARAQKSLLVNQSKKKLLYLAQTIVNTIRRTHNQIEGAINLITCSLHCKEPESVCNCVGTYSALLSLRRIVTGRDKEHDSTDADDGAECVNSEEDVTADDGTEEFDSVNDPVYVNRKLRCSGCLPHLANILSDVVADLIPFLDNPAFWRQRNNINDKGEESSSQSCVECAMALYERFGIITSIVDSACCLSQDNRRDLSEAPVLVDSLTRLTATCLRYMQRPPTPATKCDDWHSKDEQAEIHQLNRKVDKLVIDLMLSSLRILTSLSHENEIAGYQFSEIKWWCSSKFTSNFSNAVADEASGIGLLFDVLKFTADCQSRCDGKVRRYSSPEKGANANGSKTEYDTCMYCLNILTNVLETTERVQTCFLRKRLQIDLKNGVQLDSTSAIPAVSWLSKWIVHQTESFQRALMEGGSKEDKKISAGSELSSQPEHEEDLSQHEEESLVMAGSGCVLLGWLLKGTTSTHRGGSRNIVNDDISQLILSELPVDMNSHKSATFVVNTLKAFLNFYRFKLGAVSVALVAPVVRLISELEMIEMNRERDD